jgi:transposase InsO family protein
MSATKAHNHTFPFSNSSREPNEKLQVDTLTINIDGDSQGFKYILTVIDCFTRWTELFLLKMLEAQEAAKHLYSYFAKRGAPLTLQSDRGTQFLNSTLAALGAIFGLKHTIITADSSEENGIVERHNKEVLHHIRAIC